MTRSAILTLGLALVPALTVAAESKEKFQLIDVAQLEELQKDTRTPVTLLDANDPEFREKNGIIPGAKLLSSFDAYDLKELPETKDAPLVFYCSNKL
jgi:rhodanese-related sulfurtransferase